jgi:hypothetical protein
LWLDSGIDTAFNTVYNRLGQQAAAAHRGLFDTTHCGAGPQQGVPIKVWVNSDPAGVDTADGEWIRIRNDSPAETLQLGGWWVRDAMLRRYTFPAGTALAPGATLTVHVGAGADSAQDLHWGLPAPIFENAGDERDLGDGAYLFDPQGDLRAWMQYPCAVACTDPNQGAVTVTAQPRRPERILVANASAAAIDLYGYVLRTRGSGYAFAEGTVLPPGQTLVVWVGGDPSGDHGLTRYWGRDGYALPDAGGWVEVSTFSDVPLACDAWGDGVCP